MNNFRVRKQNLPDVNKNFNCTNVKNKMLQYTVSLKHYLFNFYK